MRCFIAVELPESIKAEIFHKFENLKESGIVSGKFVEKENLHLTLKFLGELTEEQIEDIKKKLSEVKFEKFNAELGNVGFFPNENYIRVIWVEILSEDVFRLQEEIENKLNEIGVKKDEREFKSHVTVARIKSVKDKKLFLEKLKKINIKRNSFVVDSFSLIKSELTSQGPIYKVLERFGAGMERGEKSL